PASVARDLAGTAACAVVAHDGSRQPRFSQSDRTQGIPLHIPIGGAVDRRRGARFGGLDTALAGEPGMAALGASARRGRLGADVGGTCDDPYNASLLDARHGCGPTGGNTTRRSGALRAGALRCSLLSAAGS